LTAISVDPLIELTLIGKGTHMSLGYGRVELRLLAEIKDDAEHDWYGPGVEINGTGMDRSEAGSRRRAAKRLEEKGMCETARVVLRGKRRLVCMTPEKALHHRKSTAWGRKLDAEQEHAKAMEELRRLGVKLYEDEKEGME